MSEKVDGLFEIELPYDFEVRSERDIESLRLVFESFYNDCPYGWLPLIRVHPLSE